MTLNSSLDKILSVVLFDRFGTKTSYTPKTASDGPVSVISKNSISSFVGSWFTVDTVNKIQLNYICWNKNTYIYTFDMTNAESTTNPTNTIKRMIYCEGQELKTSNTLTDNNVIALVSPETYESSFVIDTGNDDSNVIEPLYDSTRVIYQITKNVKFDEINGNLIVNVISTPAATTTTTTSTPPSTGTTTTTAPPATGTTTTTSTPPSTGTTTTTAPPATGTTTTTAPPATGTTTTTSTPPATGTTTTTSTPPSTGTSGFRNIEGFTVTTTNTIDVYKRKVTSIGLVTTPTNIYTEPTEKTLSTTMENSSMPYFVNDPIGNHTVIYWPTDQKTLIIIMSNTYTPKLMGIPSVKMVLCSTSLSDLVPETTPPRQEQVSNPNSDAMMDDFTKWSQYMLKTEVVPPVCPACPSCNTGGLCMDCGGKGGCGTKSSDGKSLADANNIKDVKGPSSAVASVGKSASGAITGTVDVAGNVVGGTVNAASNLFGGTVNAASNLVGGTIGTAADLLKSAGSGLNSLASGDVRRVGYNQSNQTNGYNRNNTGINMPSNQPSQLGLTSNVPIDVYSYNGALQSKGADFRPLTASFSAFSK